MAKPWPEIESSSEYQALSPEKQLRAKQLWFDRVVTPKIDDPDKLDQYRERFFEKEITPTVEQQPPTWLQTIDSAAGRAVSNVLGLPGDIASMLGTFTANAIGKPEWGGPVPGLTSEAIRSGMERIGADTSAYKRGTGPQQFAGRAAQELFETGLMLGPISQIARGSLALGREAIGATGTGLGAATAQAVAPDSPLAELVGSVGGGMAGDLAVSGARAVAGPAGQFASGLLPRSPAQTRQAVGQALAERATEAPYISRNLERAAELRQQYGFDPTLAQATGDPFFMTKTKAISAQDPQLASQIQENLRTQNEIIRDAYGSIAPEGDITDTYSALKEIFENKTSRINAMQGELASRRDRVLAGISRAEPQQQVGRGVRGRLEENVDQWKRQAKSNFDAIPKAQDIPSEDLTDLSRRMIDEAQGDMDIVPRVAGEISGKTKTVDTGLVGPDGMPITAEKVEPVTFDYLRQKRTQLNRELRQIERGASTVDPQRAGNIKRMLGGIEQTLDDWAASGNTEAMRKYRNARQHYREGAEKFRRGETRAVLSRTPAGDIRVPDSAVLDQYISTGKGAIEKAQEYKKIFGDDPESMNAMVDHLVARAAELTPGGSPNPKTIQRYMHKHREILGQFPEAKKRINEFLRNENIAENLMRENKAMRSEAEKRIAKLYLNDVDPERLMNRIMSGNNPRQKMREAYKMVSSNPEAKAGLRRGFIDWMSKRVTSKQPDIAGGEQLMPNQMRSFISDNKDFMNQLYTKQELKTIDDVLDMAVMTSRVKGPAMPGGSDTATKLTQGAMSLNSILSRLYSIERGVVSKGFVVREMGARIGNMIFRGMNEDQARTLMRDALTNTEVAKALMTKVNTKQAKKSAEFLRGYLTAAVAGAVPEQQMETAQ
jgi:hypothetical protein